MFCLSAVTSVEQSAIFIDVGVYSVIYCCLILCIGQLKDAAAEIAKVMQSRQEAEQQVSASKVKMDVLSNYFKDKEKELMRYVVLLYLLTITSCQGGVEWAYCKVFGKW